MKKYLLVFFLFLGVSGYAQNSINNYKYVIVPEKFDFLKEKDQYDLNSLTKALLQDRGFTVYFDNAELPTDLANNKCQALMADVQDKSGMFSTSLILLFKDCHGAIVFQSKVGKSREKEYKTGYNLALRDAFVSFDQLKYAYNGSVGAPVQTPAAAAATPVAVPEKQLAVAAVATTAAQPVAAAVNQAAGTLYAQAIANGYQLIDTTPKIVLTLLKTTDENYFIASNASANGIVLKKNGDWVFEYYQNGKLVAEKLQVKF
jgi:hypothetical protein